MGTKGAKMVARDTSVPITMKEVLNWWVELQSEKNDQIEVRMLLTGSPENPMVRIHVIGREPTIGGYGAVKCDKSIVWPTGSHKTVLGALMWLFISMGDDYTADEALTGLLSTS